MTAARHLTSTTFAFHMSVLAWYDFGLGVNNLILLLQLQRFVHYTLL